MGHPSTHFTRWESKARCRNTSAIACTGLEMLNTSDDLKLHPLAQPRRFIACHVALMPRLCHTLRHTNSHAYTYTTTMQPALLNIAQWRRCTYRATHTALHNNPGRVQNAAVAPGAHLATARRLLHQCPRSGCED